MGRKTSVDWITPGFQNSRRDNHFANKNLRKDHEEIHLPVSGSASFASSFFSFLSFFFFFLGSSSESSSDSSAEKWFDLISPISNLIRRATCLFAHCSRTLLMRILIKKWTRMESFQCDSWVDTVRYMRKKLLTFLYFCFLSGRRSFRLLLSFLTVRVWRLLFVWVGFYGRKYQTICTVQNLSWKISAVRKNIRIA